jgi:hypothetical protein
MTDDHNSEQGHGTAGAEHVRKRCSAPKWAALVEDSLFPMPRQRLDARDILDQAGVRKDFVLVRDYGSPNNVILGDEMLVDLAEGNVFRVIPRCDATPQALCTGPAKLAFACDDEWEVTLIGKQTGRSLKRLLGVPHDAVLLRDFESPQDEPIADDDMVEFEDGAVFTCRGAHASKECKIVVNGREKFVAGESISYADLVVLAFGSIDPNSIYTITFKHGPASNPEGKMVAGDVVKTQCGMHFNVTPTSKS